MKRSKIFMATAILGVLTLGACSKDKDDEPKTPQNPTYDQTIQSPNTPIPEL